ncbi:MAG: hypothetical protein M3383_01890 [Actinomycetota bacterium]|nr:hypothetical protein [Actinomycetota bacterium]
MGHDRRDLASREIMRRAVPGPVVALALLAIGAAPALAQDPSRATEPQAIAQLEEATAALSGAEPSADVTNELRELALALPALDGAERRRARRILARPPHGEANGSDSFYGAVWGGPATAERQFYDSPGGQFRIHYVISGEDAPDPEDATGEVDVPDYVELVANRADTSEVVQNDNLGWPAPKSDGDLGGLDADGMSRTDIYLADLDGGLFGYAAIDVQSDGCDSAPYRCFAYLVLDNDYAEFSNPVEALEATAAHEYNHVLQFNLDTNQDSWMLESTATWAEEKVFPDADDWVRTFMGDWADSPHIPITKSDSKYYGSAVWNHWLDSRYGADPILHAWQLSRAVSPKDYAVGAYDRAIREAAGVNRGFARAFGQFAAATSEWRSGYGGFPDAADLPDVRRQGTLTRGRKGTGLTLDNTAYRLFGVDPRGAGEITLRVAAPSGLRAGIALVARKGPNLAPDRVIRRFKEIPGTGSGSVTLRGARGFDRITAVVVNADGRVTGPKNGGEFDYRRDNQRLTAKVR